MLKSILRLIILLAILCTSETVHCQDSTTVNLAFNSTVDSSASFNLDFENPSIGEIYIVSYTVQYSISNFSQINHFEPFTCVLDTPVSVPALSYKVGSPYFYVGKNTPTFTISGIFNPSLKIDAGLQITVLNLTLRLRNILGADNWRSDPVPTPIYAYCYYTYRYTRNGVNHLANNFYKFDVSF